MDKTNFLGHITVIDNFASTGLEAVLIDESFFMVYDTLQKMETIRNPQGLYWNYYYHIWQVLSTSRFANAVAFVSGEVAPITQVIVDPNVGAMRAGKSMEFNAYVRATDGSKPVVTWAIVGDAGTVIRSGTSINNNGELTLSADQLGQIKVTATASYTEADGETVVDVVGEAVVTVIPNA